MNIKIYVVFGIFLCVEGRSMKDIENRQKCRRIKPFYGGDVLYFGDRKRGSFAFYSCDDDFSIFPTVAEKSECTYDLDWVPTSPRCLKKTQVKKVANSYTRGNKDILLHGETYDLYCYSGYEFRDRDGFLEQTSVQITNNNGTLYPEFPTCEEARCDPADHNQTIVEYADGSKVTSKILSGTKVRLTCKDGYDYYRGEKPLHKPVKRKCEKGTIKRAPVCEEARCLFSGNPSNGNTYHRKHRDGRNYLVPDQYIYAREKVEVICRNKEDYELYVNSTEMYLDTFNSECRFGQLGDAKSFPICLEKRCHFKPDLHVCLFTSDKGKCEDEDFEVQSGTTVSIQCRKGYKLYRSEDGSSVEANSSTSITCSKGTYAQGFKCIPGSLEEKILQFAKDKLEQNDKVIDRFTCKFSIFGSSACSDPCLVPKIPFAFAKSVKFGDKLSGEVEHGTQMTIQCGDGYDLSERMTTTCKFGEWETDRYPYCSPKPCKLVLETGTSFWVDSELLTADDGAQKTIANGTKVDIECANGYEMKNLKTKTKGKNARGDSTCVLGTWTYKYSCEPESCSIPVVHDAIIRPKATKSYKHNDKIIFECDDGHHFVGSSTPKEMKDLTSTCTLGNWSHAIPTGCQPDSCNLTLHEGSRYYMYLANGSEEIRTPRLIEHDTNVLLQCMEHFDVFGKDDIIVKETNSSPVVTCRQGRWGNMHYCKKQCVVNNVTSGYVVRTGENITAGETVAHNENITVKCENYKDLSITCNHGTWNGSIDCVGESSIATTETIEPENDVTTEESNIEIDGDISNESQQTIEETEESTTPYAAKTTEYINTDDTVTDESHQINDQVEGCTLPSDKKYTYMDDGDNIITQGSMINSGTTLTVTCTTIDYYGFIASYGDYSYGTPSPTVTCTGNELSNIDLNCPEVQLASCMVLQDGKVKQSISSTYHVSCDEGFSLDLILPEHNECICKDGVLKSIVGNQQPACMPDNCVFPFEIDARMSVFNKYRVSLSGGSTVDNGDFLYFNCSKADEQKYEPLNRRFRCSKGQWLEDEKDPNWKFGNNGAFPKCREAECEPVCKNGGVCYKDNSCRCKHLTTGDQCEKVLCNDQCIENGGTCTALGNCSCPARQFGNNCELIAVYLIRVKTVGDSLAGVGTDARVYIYLHGLKGKTDKIFLTGSFESSDLYETRRHAKYIGPITRVEVGRDGGGFRLDWNFEYASIFVENMNEYYVFRQNEPVWVYQGENVVLPIQGNCISSFDEGHTWYPKWKQLRASDTYYISKGSTMSRQACQQMCTELTALLCKSVLYHRDTSKCWGFAVSDLSYFTVTTESSNSRVHLRFCK